jgi:histidinol phosphatase-like enzyme
MAFVWFQLWLLLAPVLGAADDILPIPRATVSSSYNYRGGKIKVLVLDADQTLRISTSRWRAPRAPSEVVILPGVRETITNYVNQGYLVAILSNQMNAVNDSGLGQVDRTMQETVRQIQSESSARIDYYDFSEIEADARPNTPMFDRLARVLKEKFGSGAEIDREHSLFSGDAAYLPSDIRPDGRHGFDTANFDRIFAENNHLPFEEPQNLFGWRDRGMDRIENVAALEEFNRRKSSTPLPCLEFFRRFELLP